jgi:hypothetical protein
MAKPKKVTEDIAQEDNQEVIEVVLAEEYKNHTGIIYKGMFLEFPEGKAIVFPSAAEELRKQGFIE